MRGVVIWGWSRCRSVMGVFRELSRQIPMRLALWQEGEGELRERQGHDPNEFMDVPAVWVGDDWSKARLLFEATAGWVHLVSPYQVSPLARKVAMAAKKRGDVVGIIGEAPWNAQHGLMAWMWELYLRTVLRQRVRAVTKRADFFVCYSGEDFWGTARKVGWTAEKIYPYGYFPPPLVGSRCLARGALSERRIRILALATKARRGRGEAVIKRALSILGAARYELLMPDFVSLNKAISLYETCDVFVAAGFNEPWGMRVNDALNCGMPFVVSDGMGVRRLVEMTHAGVSFCRGDAQDLALKIEEVVDNYPRFAQAAAAARAVISPVAGARRMMEIIAEGANKAAALK